MHFLFLPIPGSSRETSGAGIKDDGSYPVSCWQWIDGDQDGVSECYYFDKDGYMLSSTTTPDGYKVDGSGAWVENGTVKTKALPEIPV